MSDDKHHPIHARQHWTEHKIREMLREEMQAQAEWVLAQRTPDLLNTVRKMLQIEMAQMLAERAKRTWWRRLWRRVSGFP